MENQKAKVVINESDKPFQLSRKAMDFLGIVYQVDALVKYNGQGRMNPRLIECVEFLGDGASAGGACLVVHEVWFCEMFVIEGNLNGYEVIIHKDDFDWLRVENLRKS